MTTGTAGTSRAVRQHRAPKQLTEARVRTICAKVAKGVPQQAAAGTLGIPKRTLQNWLAIGREPDAPEPYASFADRLQAALDKFHESRAVAVAADPDPRMAMQVLERRFPDDWADPKSGGTTVNVNLQAAPEWLELRARILAALARHPDALADVLAELGGGQVLDGEAVELAELAA